MSFTQFKVFYALLCVGLGLIILLPTLTMVISLPSGEEFSEIYLLGSNHMAEDIPYRVSPNQVYRVYLGIGNHMGRLTRYRAYVKLGNQTQSFPNDSVGAPSSLKPIFEYGAILMDDDVWEKEIEFSFLNVSFSEKTCEISRLALDDNIISVDQLISWNANAHGFYCQLFFELWHYDTTASETQYQNRFVGFWLNMSAIR